MVEPPLPHRTVDMELLFQLSKDFFEDSPFRKSHTQDDSAVENVDPSAPTYEMSALCSVLC